MGIVEWFGNTACKPISLLDTEGNSFSTVYSAVKKKDKSTEPVKLDKTDNKADDSVGENTEVEKEDYEIVARGKRVSKIRGSIRQVSIKLILVADTQIKEYDAEGEDLGDKTMKSISLSFPRNRKLSMLTWVKWLNDESGKKDSIIAMISPDGVRYPIKTT
jgi:hypothetical protein